MEKLIKAQGVILSILANPVFRVELADNNQVLARVSAARREQFIRMLPGDRVKMQMTSDGLKA